MCLFTYVRYLESKWSWYNEYNILLFDITKSFYRKFWVLTLQAISKLIAVHICVRIEFINSICLVHHIKVVLVKACDELEGQTSWLEAAAVRPGVIGQRAEMLPTQSSSYSPALGRLATKPVHNSRSSIRLKVFCCYSTTPACHNQA